MTRNCLSLFTLLTAPLFAASSTFAQEEETETPTAKNATQAEETTDEKPKDKTEATPETGPQAKAWQAKLTEWKMLLSDLNLLRAKYNVAKEEDIPQIREEYSEKLEQGRQTLSELKIAGRAAFEEAPNEDRELVRFLVKVAADEVRAERYESAFEAATFLVDHGCEEKPIYNLAGLAAFGTNRMALAKEYLDQAKELEAFSPEGREALAKIEHFDLVKLWEKEAEVREAEADDNLPRVKLTTSQGDIVVELFENEAPGTVGNFVSLVEKGFYDGRLFHRVLPGFMAQTGCPEGDGTGGPGYAIYTEAYEDNARKHFAGTLAMAKSSHPQTGPIRDSERSQFYITFAPRPSLNKDYTVFGRVIEGWDTLAKIQRYDPDVKGPKPPLDKIEVAEVIRKRDHEYKPKKVP